METKAANQMAQQLLVGARFGSDVARAFQQLVRVRGLRLSNAYAEDEIMNMRQRPSLKKLTHLIAMALFDEVPAVEAPSLAEARKLLQAELAATTRFMRKLRPNTADAQELMAIAITLKELNEKL